MRGVNVAPGQIRWNDVVRWPEPKRSGFERYELRVDDLVLGLDRPVIAGGTRIARLAEDDVPSLLLQRVARIRMRGTLMEEFALLVLSAQPFRNYIAPIFTGVSVPHLSPDQVKEFRLGLPPKRSKRTSSAI
jgi:type I restriction enzyme S subunit